jgi:hypothetical protein
VLRDDGMSHGDYVEQLTYLSRVAVRGQRPGSRTPAGRRGGDAVGHQQHKLFAPGAGQHVGGPNLPHHGLRHLLQHPIAS